MEISFQWASSRLRFPWFVERRTSRSTTSLRLLLRFRELFPQFRRAVDRFARSEILQLEKLANFDLAFLAFAVGIGDSLSPFDRLLLRFHIDDPVARDQLFGLGTRPVDHRSLRSRELDARALRA